MATTLLITTQQVKDLTSVPNNVSDTKLNNWMRYGQDVTLEKVIRSACLTELIDAVDNNTLTADQTTLIDDYITPYMAHLVYWLAIPDLWATITPTGIQTKSGTDFNSITKGEIHVLRASENEVVDQYLERLLCYLNKNIAIFPCFTECGDCETPIVGTSAGNFAFRKGTKKYFDSDYTTR